MSQKIDIRQIKVPTANPMIGSAANDTLDTILPKVDAEIAKLYEDRNITLSGGGQITNNSTGTSVSFTANLNLTINSQVAGGSPTVISLGSTTRAFSADGNMLYATVVRTGTPSATLTADATSLPAVTSSNEEIFLIAKRIGTTIFFRDGLVVPAGYIQSFGGSGISYISPANDAASTGSNTTIAALTSGLVRLTNSSLVSVSGIPAGIGGQQLILENQTGNQVTINNQEATATAANRIYTGSGSNVSMPANATFIFTYDATAARWMLTGGSGSGSGSGGKNYMTTYLNNPGNGDFESASTTGWSLKHSTLDANNKMPNQASGSWTSANANLSLTVSSTNPLAGTNSGVYASTTSTVAGDMMVSDPFTIDIEDRNAVLAVQLQMKVSSGASNGNFSKSINNSFSVAMYDVTNSVWIQCSNNYGLIQTANTTSFYGTFQTSLTGTQYRLALYNMNASAGAITLQVDDFKVGPQAGAAGTGFVAPTVQKFLSGSGTYITPTGPSPAFIKVRMIGGGGGGGGSGTSAGTAGGTGGNTTFGSFATAFGGTGGALVSIGNGGTTSLSSPGIAIFQNNGANGSGGSNNVVTNTQGGAGAGTPFGGGGSAGIAASGTGGAQGGGGQVPGAGGGGAGNASTSANQDAGGGGGAGGYLEFIVPSPASSYTYAVGSAGSAGGAGGSGAIGGAGAAGIIIVEEYYSSALTTGGAISPSTGPTIQKFLSGSGTYITPTGPSPSYIEVEMMGGGGGGGGSGTSGQSGGGTGGTTTFGPITANGGVGGQAGFGSGGAGGTASLGSGPIGVAIQGSTGQAGSSLSGTSSAAYLGGASGGCSPFGGAGSGGNEGGGAGTAAISNTGSGGGGGSAPSGTMNLNTGPGGGSGGYVKAIITTPASSYSYAVGAAGTGGTAGSSGYAGGAGGSGVIIVREYYAATAQSPVTNVSKAPTVQIFTSGSGTYTTPTGPIPLYLKVTCVGGGGGGGPGNSTTTAGGTGGTSTFGASLLTALGGTGGAANAQTSAGGTNTINSPAITIANIQGGQGGSANATTVNSTGGAGGLTPRGGNGGGGFAANVGGTASSGTGSGGGGAGGSGGNASGSGGGGGGYIQALIYSPSSSYSYSVGAAGTAGTGVITGGAGGSGIVIVEEFYE